MSAMCPNLAGTSNTTMNLVYATSVPPSGVGYFSEHKEQEKKGYARSCKSRGQSGSTHPVDILYGRVGVLLQVLPDRLGVGPVDVALGVVSAACYGRKRRNRGVRRRKSFTRLSLAGLAGFCT